MKLSLAVIFPELIARFLFLLVLTSTLLTFAVSLHVVYISLLSGCVASFFLDKRFLYYTSFLLFSSIALLIALVHFLKLEDSFYYMPSSRVSFYDQTLGIRRYKPDRQVEMTMPFGNLTAISLKEKEWPNPRDLVFSTDSHGFRNNESYNSQQYILIGDSFIVGTANSQENTLSNQLLRDYQVESYSVSAPGYVDDYGRLIDHFEQAISSGAQAKYLIFFFEGNDFPEPRPRLEKLKVTITQRMLREFEKININRIAQFMVTRYKRKKELLERSPVSIYKINDKKMGFLNRYSLEVSERRTYEGGEDFDEFFLKHQKQIEHMYFIPTKYRIYYSYIETSKRRDARQAYLNDEKITTPLPHAQWNFLKRKADFYKIPATDLTPLFETEAKKIMEQGEWLYWPDDTHWNKHGIRVTAKLVAKNLDRV